MSLEGDVLFDVNTFKPFPCSRGCGRIIILLLVGEELLLLVVAAA